MVNTIAINCRSNLVMLPLWMVLGQKSSSRAIGIWIFLKGVLYI